jgi:hypothetical protein
MLLCGIKQALGPRSCLVSAEVLYAVGCNKLEPGMDWSEMEEESEAAL